MKVQLVCLAAFAALFVACGGSEPKPAAPAPAPAPSKLGENPVAAPLDYIAAIGKAQKANISRLDQAKLIDAIQKFEAAESRPPKDLEEIVKMGYIAAIPVAPPGMKLEYKPGDGSFMYVPLEPAPTPK